jgi:AraC family transcriptional regulator
MITLASDYSKLNLRMRQALLQAGCSSSFAPSGGEDHATDSKSTASGVARRDGPGALYLDVSLTWAEGSKDFDNHCPAIAGYHLMVYTLSGTGRLFQQQGRRELHADFAPGSIMIRPAGSSERVYGSVPERLRVGISERLVVEAMAEIRPASTVDLVPVLNVHDPLIRSGASILWDELLKPRHPAQGLLVEGVATMLAAHLVRRYEARSRPPDDRARRLDPAALRSVLGYMHDHIDQHIALDELSKVAGVSRFHFIRLFRASTGSTPMKYLESCRIEFARKLIRESNLSMPEIALAVGFADQSHFVKRFRRHAGCTPGQYAAQVGGRTDSRHDFGISSPATSNGHAGE